MNNLICGELKGDFKLYFLGACKKPLKIEDAYRCTGCGGWFHRDCIFEHFEKDEKHSIAHNSLKKIQDLCNPIMTPIVAEQRIQLIKELCKKGLCRDKQQIKFINNK